MGAFAGGDILENAQIPLIIKHQGIIKGQLSQIDFDFQEWIDCRLIEVTRPTKFYIDVNKFLPMYTLAKRTNDSYFSNLERGIINRVLVLDIMANLGREAGSFTMLKKVRTVISF
jgi:hypothetical protein